MISPKIIEYKVITDHRLVEFNKAINMLIKQGWQPFGTPWSVSGYYSQAVVRYEEIVVPSVTIEKPEAPRSPIDGIEV